MNELAQQSQAAEAPASVVEESDAPQNTADVWSRCPVGEQGLQFPTFNEIWSYSRMLVQAGMCTKGDTQAKVAAKITLGLELGLKLEMLIRI